MEVEFSINLYDKDGDQYDECVNLHFGRNLILRLENVDELEQVVEELNKIKKEILTGGW